jgi:drug/metabolite transporter (DMT)-like permease
LTFERVWILDLIEYLMSQKTAYILIFITALISGVSVFLNNFGVSRVDPYVFTGWKNILVLVFVFSWLLMVRDWPLLKSLSLKKWLSLFGVGVLGGSIPFLLFFKGLSMVGGSQAAFIHKTMFVFVVVLAMIFLKEKIKKEFLIGGFLLLLGNLMLFNLLPMSFNWGLILVVGATLFWASENVLSKYLLKDLSFRVVICGRMGFGSFLIVLFWFITGQMQSALNLNLEQIGWLLITSVFLLGYVVTWYSGLKYVKVSVAAVILTLGSLVTTVLEWSFLNQSFSFISGIGLVLIALAVFLVLFQEFRYYENQPKNTV